MEKEYKENHFPHISSLLAATLIVASLLGPIGMMAARMVGM